MDINSIGNNYGLGAISTNQTAAAQLAATGSTSSSDSTQLSPMASLLNQLQQLQQTDPNKFKSVMSSIADTLTTDAQSATGPKAKMLTDLANKFSQAAQTGQMPDLQPPGQQQGVSGHHHHHHQAKSYQDSSSTSASSQGKPSTDLAQIIQAALQQSGG
jgi:hypothetical protein